ncbi:MULTISPECIES: 2-hydroxyacid dehydrogenase [Pseudomonas]|uniref:2-hydroxyacid dehydrogenase n=1 Tax=Pseudomonas psychrophila TaxID=122355 RepID=A0A8I1KAH3_9PSED|nr:MULTISPECIES: 2-hydroxyacid dehydrogenase [Pseudomonas]KOX64491.1 2-hydroxyacid dehydrogenase [Pseudomonas psychrophila]MBJ2258688.1 2-hydroxyacid dehydrogenase [Pseudomonas psychrophila]MDY7584665.1 2-hydroxyacid dehydrogenase [Pseudomonas sp. CCI3.1]MEB0069237.1 2-hydroxyacid dehydrogenase [Pseudomonas sp. CCI3.1]MEB0074870.1 2-hydroxyacid dehydrogenase [Pseudomonas sp. CCI1.4]
MAHVVLVLVETVNDYLPLLEREGFELILAPTPSSRAEAIAEHGARINAVLTRGPLGLYAEEIADMPSLLIICVIGAGYEHVDLQAASNRGVVVTNGAGANASSVADHAMALLLSLVRGIPQADAGIRRGEWNKLRQPSLAGKRMGILGLGAVGMAIAKRAANGFDMSISYHTRQERHDMHYTYCKNVIELASSVDFLIVATPGGSETRHLVDTAALYALGRNGYLINIARASVVDTQALIDALAKGKIAGAGLDVFDDEPQVPDALKLLGNVVMTPHMGGQSPEAAEGTVQMVVNNLLAFFAGQPVLTPVRLPEPQ